MSPNLVETCSQRLRLSAGQNEKFRRLVVVRTAELGFDERETRFAVHTLDTVLWKFNLAGVHLERLWAFRETLGLQAALDASLSHHRLNNAEEVAAALELEGFLFQARALLDVLMLHVLAACRAEFPGKMSRKKFEKLVTDLPKDHNKKARCAEEYLNTEVFDEDRWGGFLRSLRDRVAHHDRIRAGRQSSEQVLDKSLDWPTIQEATFHRRAQEFENHAWEMLTTVIPSLWDREWIVGPYREGMWDTV